MQASNEVITANNFGIWTAFHEIAQINIAKALAAQGMATTLEYPIPYNKFSGRAVKTCYYEADVVANNYWIWEVKPITTSPEKQLVKYINLSNLHRGKPLATIDNIPIINNIKMKIIFAQAGYAQYSFYKVNDKGERNSLNHRFYQRSRNDDTKWRLR